MYQVEMDFFKLSSPSRVRLARPTTDRPSLYSNESTAMNIFRLIYAAARPSLPIAGKEKTEREERALALAFDNNPSATVTSLGSNDLKVKF